MKKISYALVLTLVVLSGFVFANLVTKSDTVKNSHPKTLTAAEKAKAMKNWEASPDGIKYKKWETSPAGTKIVANAHKIVEHVKDSVKMEATVVSLSLPKGSRLGYGIMVRIENEDYILSFGNESTEENLLKINHFQELRKLKVNDKILIKSGFVSLAPKYAYPIVSGDYVEQNGKIIYKRAPRKGGC